MSGFRQSGVTMRRRWNLVVMIGTLAVIGSAVPSLRADTIVITTDTTIDAGNVATYENQDVVVQGCTVTINVPLALHSLVIERNASNLAGAVTHAAALAGGLQLTVATNVFVQGADGALVASRIDASRRGHPAHTGPGAGAYGPNRGGGGGYGGYGGRSSENAAGGGIYGSLLQPTDLGSGGAGDIDGYHAPGGAGGGALHLIVGGTLTVSGQLSANGGVGARAGGESAGGGSGGSLWLEVATLAGDGIISATGGNAGDNYAGGAGGGRIALYYATDSFTGQLSAHGGTGYVAGGAGTILRHAPGQAVGTLILDNGGTAGGITDLLAPEPVFDSVVVRGAAVLDRLGGSTLSAGALEIQPTGIVTHNAGGPGITLDITGDITIAADGWLHADERGFAPVAGPGAGSSGPDFGGGGGYGGCGGRSLQGAAGGGIYGSVLQPLDLGSGGAGDADGPNAPGGRGGGAIHLIVGGTLAVAGEISARGGNGAATTGESGGGGSGGSLWIEAATLTGDGVLSANGGNAGDNRAGGGGGGRIALYYAADNSAGQIAATGGSGNVHGGAGTILRMGPSNTRGALTIANAGTSGAITDLPAPVAPFDSIALANGAVLDVPGETTLEAGRFDILTGATLRHRAAQSGLALLVSGNMTVAGGGALDLRLCGFPRATGPGAGANGPDDGSGAGHGGRGGNSSQGSAGGGVYGSLAAPVELGSGGGSDADGPNAPGGAGGGAVHIEVSGTLTVDGSLNADGQNGATSGSESGGGGSGGSVWLAAGTLVGAGTISANGGNGGTSGGGGGGGGRIAIHTCDLQMNPAQITIEGGTGFQAGGAGTFFHGSPYITITQQPVGGIYFVGQPVTLTINASTTHGTLLYQWRKDGENLVENPPHLTGTQTATLHIDAAIHEDQGDYGVWLTDDCGAGLSDTVRIIVPPPGDLTCDGAVTFDDINPFVLALSDPAGYQQRYPHCRLLQGDCNGDGLVNFDDINPFVAILSRGT
ncbi:MAG: immunoglobulin domain-containing protein [Planctomycetota bacterium]